MNSIWLKTRQIEVLFISCLSLWEKTRLTLSETRVKCIRGLVSALERFVMKRLSELLRSLVGVGRSDAESRQVGCEKRPVVVELGSANRLVRGAPNGPFRDSQGGFSFR
jgi:hypothetical protein